MGKCFRTLYPRLLRVGPSHYVRVWASNANVEVCGVENWNRPKVSSVVDNGLKFITSLLFMGYSDFNIA
ncbi:hypothetical protein V2G26_012786 [Clonostachys chloroleuca]